MRALSVTIIDMMDEIVAAGGRPEGGEISIFFCLLGVMRNAINKAKEENVYIGGGPRNADCNR